MSSFDFDRMPGFRAVDNALRFVWDKCYRIERQLSLYVDDELTPSQMANIDKHIVDCPSCKAALNVLQAAHLVLSQRERATPPTYLTERLRQAIAIEATRPLAVAPRPTFLLRNRLAIGGVGAAVLAASAAILIAYNNNPTPHFNPTNTAKGGSNVRTPLTHVAALPTTSPLHHRIKSQSSNYIASSQIERRPEVPYFSPGLGRTETPEAIVSKKQHMSMPTGIEPAHHEMIIAEKLPSVTHYHAPSNIATYHAPVNEIATNVPDETVKTAPIQSSTQIAVAVTQQEQTPATTQIAADTGGDTYRMSLVDQMRSMALSTQTEQPRLLRLAIAVSKLPSDSDGLVPINGSRFH